MCLDFQQFAIFLVNDSGIMSEILDTCYGVSDMVINECLYSDEVWILCFLSRCCNP